MVTGKRFLLLILMSAMLPMLVSFVPQESRVNQKKIERERARKQKQARADYEKAVRRHNIRQSKSTRASMKKMKKESKKVTPNIH